MQHGAQMPRFSALPEGRAGSSGPECIAWASALGYELDPWQCWLIDGILSEDEHYRLIAEMVLVLIPRQNGKNVVLEVVELYAFYVLEFEVIIHSAHRADTAADHMGRLRSVIFNEDNEAARELAAVTQLYEANGKEKLLRLDTYAELRFVTRSKKIGRGRSPRMVVFDEALYLTDAQIAAMIPSLSAQSMRDDAPIMIYTSSAPIAESLVLHRVRDACHAAIVAGRPGRRVVAEWSVPREVDGKPIDHTDRVHWFASNPGLGIRISPDWVEENELSTLSAEDFMVERLGIPVDPEVDTDVEHRKFVAAWPLRAVAAAESMLTGLPIAVAIDVSPSRTTAIAVAGLDQRGERRLEVIDHRPGTTWVVERIVEICTGARPKAHGVEPSPVMRITIDGASPANSLIPDINRALAAAGIELTVDIASTRRLTQACVGLWDGIIEGTVCHIAQVTLDQAVVAAKRRPVGDSWAWGRRATTEDISPLVATSLALGAWAEHEATPVEVPVSAFVAFV